MASQLQGTQRRVVAIAGDMFSKYMGHHALLVDGFQTSLPTAIIAKEGRASSHYRIIHKGTSQQHC
jgi:O-methyltransferase involved in polyketide biosynthesis